MHQDKEYSIWNETRNLMSKDSVKISKLFLDKLIANDDSLLDSLFKYKFAAKMIPQNSKILEMNCDQGFGAPILGEMSTTYVGFDKNPSSIQNAKQSFTKDTFTFTSKIINSTKFDVVVDLNSYKFLEDLKNFDYQIIEKYLRQDGIFIISIENKIFHDKTKYKKALQNMLIEKFQSYFSFILKFHSQNNFIDSGFSTNADHLFLICMEKQQGK